MDASLTIKHIQGNRGLSDKIHELNGRFDRRSGSYKFDAEHEASVTELLELYFGEMVTVEITAKHDIKASEQIFTEKASYSKAKPVEFLGYEIYGDKPNILYKNCNKISGPGGIGGDETVVYKGSVFHVEVPKKLLETRVDKNWDVKVL